jgi:hypothetical protein
MRGCAFAATVTGSRAVPENGLKGRLTMQAYVCTRAIV